MNDKDPYSILKIEFDGIKNVIVRYTSQGTISNYLNKLETAIHLNDGETILYCLDGVQRWYNSNISKITANSYVFNPDEHIATKKMVDFLCESLREYDFSHESSPQKESARDSRTVFIVHGHDSGAKMEVARTLEKLKLIPIILHEQSDNGMTIIEKLQHCSAEAAFAVVLYTECDLGRDKEKGESDNRYRARQNVVFEHGMFTATLGRDHVCALVKGDVEIPGDLDGVVYINMDDAGAWKMQLCSNMRCVGIEIDMNDLLP